MLDLLIILIFLIIFLIILIWLIIVYINSLCLSDKSVVDILISIICGLREVIENRGIATSEDSTRHTTELVCGSAAIERYIVVDEVGIA